MLRTILGLLPAAVCAWAIGHASGADHAGTRINAPFVETPLEYVDIMLRLASAGPGDVLYDLGSGDGRIPITAAQRYGISKAVGVEIDPDLVRVSMDNAGKAGVSDRVRFVQGDVFKADFREATVVTLYLLQHLNIALRSQLLEQLKPGTRIVSYEFHLGEWLPDRSVPQSDRPVEALVGKEEDMPPHVFLWTVPARVHGRWRVRAGAHSFDLRLAQSFQLVTGEVATAAGASVLRTEPLSGTRIRFSSAIPRPGNQQPFEFDGTVAGDAIHGTLTVDGQALPARAERLP